MKRNYQKLFITTAMLCMGAIALSSCGGNPKRALGLNKEAPDEFTVVAKAPLVLPPEYNLVPPGEISATAEDVRPQSKPKDILFSDSKNKSNATEKNKPADSAKVAAAPSKNSEYDNTTEKFLTMAGAKQDNSGIRKTINKETGMMIEENQTIVDKIMFWNDEVVDPTAVTVNAAAEKKRLKDNAKSGKSSTDGETPSIKPERSLF